MWAIPWYPVITEAKIVWDLTDDLDDETQDSILKLVAGRFWWPFGLHNNECFSAVNQFNVVSPVSVQVVPTHYNEVGLMTEGEVHFASALGLNYLFSIGNGAPSFEMSDIIGGAGNESDLDGQDVSG